MNRFSNWMAGGVALLLLVGFVFLSFLAGSPKDAYSMVRYALPRWMASTDSTSANEPMSGRWCWCSGVSLDRRFVARSATSFRFMKITRNMPIF